MKQLKVFIAALCLSCTSTVPALSVEGVQPVERCSQPAVPERQVRRLTAAEYDATVLQVLKVDAGAQATFPPETGALFSTLSSAQIASTALSEKLEASAERIAAQVDFGQLGLTVDDANASLAIERMGRQLFRRPLSSDELQRFAQFRTEQRTRESEDTAFRLVLQVMLQSPQFLFLIEPAANGTERKPVDSVHLATRLAFVLWGRAPDEALLNQASDGGLSTREQVRAVAQQMLADPRARDSVARFHIEWLGAARLNSVTRNDPRFEPLRQSLIDEVGLFGTAATLDDNSFSQLLSGRFTYMNEGLGSLYGLPLTGPSLRRVSTQQLQRGGLLTLGGVLTSWSKANESSPVLRGKFVRERLLCETVAPPPGNVITDLPPVTEGTTRQRYAAHANNVNCSGCHQRLDPIGFGFERYDAIGGFRLVENGQQIDARGELRFSLDSDGAFEGALALGQTLARSQQVRHCVALQWFRYALGRYETDSDACTLDALYQAVDAPDAGPRDIVLNLVTSDAFRLQATEVQP